MKDHPCQLSGGMQQLIMIAMALSCSDAAMQFQGLGDLAADGGSLNRRFAACAAAVDDYHVPIVDGTDLRGILCVDHVCPVGRNGVVPVGGRRLRLLRGARDLPASVVVCEWLDGSLDVLHDGAELPFQEPGAAAAMPRLVL